MLVFLSGLVLFLGSHFFTALARGARGQIISRIGEASYKGVYALVSLAGFALIYLGWPHASQSVLYISPPWFRQGTYLLTLLALIVLMSGYLPAGKLVAAVKHPMLLAVKLWAAAHLLVNGDVRSLLLFGSFLAYAVIDRIAVNKRGGRVLVAGPARNDILAVLVGAALWFVIYRFLHPYIAGVELG